MSTVKDESVIPKGMYCYEGFRFDPETQKLKVINLCPYWSRREDKPAQMNGYCSFLEAGDWEDEGLSLLWDQCKECGINEGEEAE